VLKTVMVMSLRKSKLPAGRGRATQKGELQDYAAGSACCLTKVMRPT
jgi:hypothetical protein